ncbi:MAG: VanZ family protein [Oscillospiraceae bacterium]|nr:VanZ family protein [Oscillospiraceae bacterium]
MKKNKVVLFLIFLVYLSAVAYITVFCREPEERRVSLNLFESYYYLLENKNSYYYNMIKYNIIMTIPFGLLVPMISSKLRNWHKVLVLGFLFSLTIETTQYITGRGLFEADDLFNNTLGAVIGYIFYALLRLSLKPFIRQNK